MKIAIATEGNKVSGHFGHSESFTFYEIQNNEVISSQNIKSPGHGHGSLPGFLKEKGAEVVIAGGMGEGAFNGLKSAGINAIIGFGGTLDEAVEKYLNGTLKTDETFCKEHHHEENHEGGCKGNCKCH